MNIENKIKALEAINTLDELRPEFVILGKTKYKRIDFVSDDLYGVWDHRYESHTPILGYAWNYFEAKDLVDKMNNGRRKYSFTKYKGGTVKIDGYNSDQVKLWFDRSRIEKIINSQKKS